MDLKKPTQALAAGETSKAPEKSQSWWQKLLATRRTNQNGQQRAYSETVDLREVVALVHHVAEKGLDPKGTLTVHIDKLLTEHKNPPKGKTKEEVRTEILKAYCKLTAITYKENGDSSKYKVNGRTVLNSQYIMYDLFIVGTFAFASFLLAATTHILGNYYDAQLVFDGTFVYLFHQHVLEYLLPAFWGALGATVFLAMKIGEHARNCTFDSRKLRGQLSRIGLGAIFGAVIVHLFYQSFSSSGFQTIGPSGIAFLTGLGVKAIYQAFEVMVNRVSDTIKKFDPREGDKASVSETKTA